MAPQLDYLGFRTFQPSRILQPYVRSYWVMDRWLPSGAIREEYIHPEGGYGLIFNLGDAFVYDGQHVTERLFLDGSNTVSRKLGFKQRVSAIGVRFYPGGAYPFLKIPMHELDNQLNLEDVLEKSPVRDLYEQLAEASTWAQRILLIEKWLLWRLNGQGDLSSIVPESLAHINRGQGQLAMGDLAAYLAISQRQLERIYKVQVGMTPMQYARLVRVTEARTALKQATTASLAQVALELGFYDQSHFIRDFKKIVGITPGRYQRLSRTKNG